MFVISSPDFDLERSILEENMRRLTREGSGVACEEEDILVEGLSPLSGTPGQESPSDNSILSGESTSERWRHLSRSERNRRIKRLAKREKMRENSVISSKRIAMKRMDSALKSSSMTVSPDASKFKHASTGWIGLRSKVNEPLYMPLDEHLASPHKLKLVEWNGRHVFLEFRVRSSSKQKILGTLCLY
jgi:hypothetical protein